MCNLMQELLQLKVEAQQVLCSKHRPNSYICSPGNTACLDFGSHRPLGCCSAGTYLQREYTIHTVMHTSCIYYYLTHILQALQTLYISAFA